MSMEILRDPRVRRVVWTDLVRVSRAEVAVELLLGVPWLAASLWLAGRGWYVAAMPFSFMFFLAGLRQGHNAFHHTVGVGRRACDGILAGLSVLMLGSMHAVKFNHLRHHAHCMSEQDVEGASAKLPAWRALLGGPLFPLKLHAAALRGSRGRQRAWVIGELAANVLWVAVVFGLLHVPALRYHVIVMAIGQCMTAFFAVWTVHHDCDDSHFIARTLRDRLKNFASMSMFYHVEHHLFPQVPTCHLWRLARRLDEAAPELQKMKVF